VALAVLGTILVVALDGASFLSRIADTSVQKDLRFDINDGTLSAISSNYLLGTGLGTFKYVYAPYQPPSVGVLVDLAHDDYLENVLELGIPAGLVFYAALLLLVIECLVGVITRRRNAIFPCLGVGASVLVGSHSALDFSMQAPAVAIAFAAMLGVAVAQSRGSTRHAARERSSPEVV
jgi:O-antigen ligase